jgi:hypothetical protein
MLLEIGFGYGWRLGMFVVMGLRMHTFIQAFVGLAGFD